MLSFACICSPVCHSCTLYHIYCACLSVPYHIYCARIFLPDPRSESHSRTVTVVYVSSPPSHPKMPQNKLEPARCKLLYGRANLIEFGVLETSSGVHTSALSADNASVLITHWQLAQIPPYFCLFNLTILATPLFSSHSISRTVLRSRTTIDTLRGGTDLVSTLCSTTWDLPLA